MIENRRAAADQHQGQGQLHREHSLNVARAVDRDWQASGMDRNKLEEVGLCGLPYDVGKILTPDEVLKKPGRLTRGDADHEDAPPGGATS